MHTKKVSLTIAEDIIALIDSVSRDMGISRSKYVSLVLRERLKEEKEREIQQAYDDVFSDDEISREQLETSKWFEGLENRKGQEW